MPWTPADAPKKTGKAKTAALRKLWADTANGVLKRTGDEAMAIKIANAAVNRHPSVSHRPSVVHARKKKS